MATKIAERLDLTKQEYVDEYINSRGWGGLPELMVYEAAVEKTIELRGPAGRNDATDIDLPLTRLTAAIQNISIRRWSYFRPIKQKLVLV